MKVTLIALLKKLVTLLEATIARLQRGYLIIDRNTPFDPAVFVGEGWEIAEQDERSLKLAEIDITKVRFETTLKQGEECIIGEERLSRLKKAGHVRLDAKVFLTLWENKHLIPESWKERIDGDIRFIFFDGTELLDPRGDRYALYLYWHGGGWCWYVSWLDFDRNARSPSVVLAS